MTINEASAAGVMIDISDFSGIIWPGYKVYMSAELYGFLGLAEEYAASLGQVINELLADIDFRIDVETLKQDVEHVIEALIGEIPGFLISLRVIGSNQLIVANPRDEITQFELTEELFLK